VANDEEFAHNEGCQVSETEYGGPA
jgi:hypothetical protein